MESLLQDFLSALKGDPCLKQGFPFQSSLHQRWLFLPCNSHVWKHIRELLPVPHSIILPLQEASKALLLFKRFLLSLIDPIDKWLESKAGADIVLTLSPSMRVFLTRGAPTTCLENLLGADRDRRMKCAQGKLCFLQVCLAALSDEVSFNALSQGVAVKALC